MSIIRMVRHGEAAASYNEHPDPGLSPRGRAQAVAVAETLDVLGPLAVASSPMARAMETAEPLAASWACAVAVEPAVSEIPSPGLRPHERGLWLTGVMSGTWAEADPAIRRWRDDIGAALLAMDSDVVVFSHFVAINAAIAVATNADTPRSRHLDHCSVTSFDTSSGKLQLLDLGDEAATKVL